MRTAQLPTACVVAAAVVLAVGGCSGEVVVDRLSDASFVDAAVSNSSDAAETVDPPICTGASDCDDNDPCTADVCDAATGCTNPEDATLCRCDAYPASCAAVSPTAVTEHHMKALEGCAFGLRRSGNIADSQQIFDEVAALAGGAQPLAAVLQNLNRTAVPGVTAQTADRLKNHPFLGFRWNAGDMATTDWYPQGITGGSDRQPDGRPEARRLVLVSWYDHTGNTPAKGVRISLVDLTSTSDVRYRHLLLVVPRREGTAPTFGPVVTSSGGALHAGGIVWIGNLLYVADTGNGFRVFDMSRIVRTTHTDDKTRIGAVGGRVDGHGYRYVVPQIARYLKPSGACNVRFSFAGLDRSATPPVIVSGEYHTPDVLGRLVSWPVDLAAGWLVAEADGHVRGVAAVAAAQNRMQGALTFQGNYYISSSSQTSSGFGRLYRTRPGLTSSISAWIYGAEDLYMERDTNRIWTAGEHPNARDTVSIHRLDP